MQHQVGIAQKVELLDRIFPAAEEASDMAGVTPRESRVMPLILIDIASQKNML